MTADCGHSIFFDVFIFVVKVSMCKCRIFNLLELALNLVTSCIHAE